MVNKRPDTIGEKMRLGEVSISLVTPHTNIGQFSPTNQAHPAILETGQF